MICPECGREIRPCNMERHRYRHEKDRRKLLHDFLAYLDVDHHIHLAVYEHPLEMVPCPSCMDTDRTGFGQAKQTGCMGLDLDKLTPRDVQVLGNGELDKDFRAAYKKRLPKCPNCEGALRVVGEAVWKDELAAWPGRATDLVATFAQRVRLRVDREQHEALQAICEGSIP